MARYLYTEPKISRSPQQPALQGLRIAQVARHQGSAQVLWQLVERYSFSLAARGSSAQFDDDQNSRRLRGFAVVDLSSEIVLNPTARLTFALENAFDRTIESGRSADGLVAVGTPRTMRMGLRVGF